LDSIICHRSHNISRGEPHFDIPLISLISSMDSTSIFLFHAVLDSNELFGMGVIRDDG
jgi:hypothetical protein